MKFEFGWMQAEQMLPTGVGRRKRQRSRRQRARALGVIRLRLSCPSSRSSILPSPHKVGMRSARGLLPWKPPRAMLALRLRACPGRAAPPHLNRPIRGEQACIPGRQLSMSAEIGCCEGLMSLFAMCRPESGLEVISSLYTIPL